MLWAMLYYFLSGTSSGLIYDISDPVKQYLKVGAMASQIITINEEMLQEEAEFAEITAKAKQQLSEINTNRLASESDFTVVFTAQYQQLTASRNRILDQRFKMRELMSAEEWRNVYAAVSQQD